jgi:tRNA pseudouridine55 synthase
MAINGFINLYKPSGITSNKALGILKFALKENNIVTKVGHMGTLDPIAEGVLPIALGRATRLFDYTLEKVKTYVATFQFGINTDTLDTEGKVTDTCTIIPSIEDIEKVLPEFIGEIDQMPPQFSAKSINGVKAYKLARQGIEVELKPKTITIYSIDNLEKLGNDTYRMEIKCSGGTYIRSIGRDLADKLNTYAIMTNLIRTKNGYFDIENSVKLDNINKINEDNIINMEAILVNMPKVIVDKKDERIFFNGIPLVIDNLPEGNFRVYFDKNIMGIASKDDDGRLKMKTWLL